jgi:DNA polymerase-3 subunit chi
MTEIDFCFNVEDKLRLVSRYAVKSVKQESRLFIFAPDERMVNAVRQTLWSFEQTSFIPHCGSGDALAAETPVIVDHVAEPLVHDDVLLSLAASYPPFFSRFKRLIEIVGNEEEDKAAARERFKFYRDRGYEIRRHDMAGKA